ncbi:hypothetical protein TNCV_2184141 [Trichonephila clavipes]|nr:hypothetical protein TNCV_2184141 [Trichonephila clavipes]
MFDPSSCANPTPLALADTSRDVLLRGGTSQGKWNVVMREDQISSSINHIKNRVQRIEWAGQVVRMDEGLTTKKVFNAQQIGTRRKGKPNLRWIDGLEKYLLVLRTKN